MYHSKLGLGFYVPSNVVTNDDLSKLLTPMTSGSKRTGIQERRHIIREKILPLPWGQSCWGCNSAFWFAKKILILSFCYLKSWLFSRTRSFGATWFRFENSGSFRCEESMFRIYLCLVCCWSIYWECIKRFGNRFRVHSTGLDMTSRGRGVSVILEMEQEQPFWVERRFD
jgi:3-oxoacyl-[acyl-carrier-protein] synthase-3